MEGDGGTALADKIAAVVRTEVGQQLGRFGKRLEAVEATQLTLRERIAALTAAQPPAKAHERMMVGKEVGKLDTRVRIIERDLRTARV